MKQFRSMIWGIAIVALGVIFGGNALGWFNINIFFDGWWTLFIIVPSVISFFTDKDKVSSLVTLMVGVVLLLAAQNVFSYEVAWKVILALILVVIGISIIVKTILKNKCNKEMEAKIKEAEVVDKAESFVAVFSGSEKKYKDEVFEGANLVAVFGGVDLDLTQAKFEKDTVIKAFALFGGIDIKVPDNVQVKMKSGFMFGGANDERKGEAKGRYTIYIDAAGAFGGVSISDTVKKK